MKTSNLKAAPAGKKVATSFPVIEVSHLSKTYGKRSTAFKAL
jgi:hypothetical protein